jgi:hypothetical protein
LILRFLLVLGAAFVAALWFFRPHWRYLSTHLPGANFDALHHLRVYRWHWDALASGDLAGIVDAPTMLPFEHGLAFGDNMLALSLTGWPLAALGHEVLAANFVVLVSYALCAAFGAGFVRALTGSSAAGIVAGAAWAFQPSRLEKIFEPNNLSIMWCALAAWAWVRWRDDREWRWVAIGGGALYVQFLSSIQMTIHVSLALGLWAAAAWAARRFAISPRVVVQIATLLVVEAALLAPWARVYAQVREHAGTADRLTTMVRYSADLGSWFGAISPGPVVWALLAIALVAAGAGRIPRGRFVGLAGLGLVLVVLSLGPFWRRGDEWIPLPYYALTKLAPVYANVRAPVRLQAIATLFLTGAAAFAVPWLTAIVVRRWPGRARMASFVVPAVVLVAVLATVPPVRSDRIEVPDPSLAEPMRAAPEDATLFLVPFHGRGNHAVPDYLQTFHRRAMVGGYQSSVPPLFFHLRNATDAFPQPAALDAIAATGATHVLLHETKAKPSQLRALDAVTAAGELTLVHRAPPWRILELPAPGLRAFDPTAPDAELSLAGPSAAAPGQRVTVALRPKVGRTYCDLVPERRARVVVTGPGGEVESEQDVVCRSQALVSPDGRAYAVTFTAPLRPGDWNVRLEWDGSRAAARELSLSVRSGLSATHDSPLGPFTLTEVERPLTVGHISQFPMTVRIRNDGDVVWLARSDSELPPDRGAVMFTVRYTELRGSRHEPKVTEFVLTQDNHHYFLPHDVAPGDEVDCRVSLRSPRKPGEFSMEIGVGVVHVTPPADWERVVLAPLVAD